MAFMNVLLKRFPGRFAWFSLRGDVEPEYNPWQLPYAASPAPKRLSRLPGLRRFINYRLFPHLQAHRAAKFAQEHGCNVLLADLAFEAVIAGHLTAQRLGVPLLVNVHDDPVERLRLKNVPKNFLRWYEKQFAKTLQVARRVGVISDYMGETYQKRYGVQTTTLYIGVEAEKCLSPRCPDPDKAPILITSLGSQRYAENWDLLIAAVQHLNTQSGSRQYCILHIGSLNPTLARPKEVIVTGWLPEEDFLRQLDRADICFLNASFESDQAEDGKLLFPLKVHSYIQAQRPMLALGPADSAVVRFVRDYQTGEVCTQPEATAFANTIKTLRSDPARCASALTGVARLLETFDRGHFFDTFETFIEGNVVHDKNEAIE